MNHRHSCLHGVRDPLSNMENPISEIKWRIVIMMSTFRMESTMEETREVIMGVECCIFNQKFSLSTSLRNEVTERREFCSVKCRNRILFLW